MNWFPGNNWDLSRALNEGFAAAPDGWYFVTMRSSLSGLCLLAIIFACPVAGDERPALKSLYDSHQWFELRDAVLKTDAPPFYRAAVVCARNDVRACEQDVKAFVKSDPRSEETYEVRSLLASACLRNGLYRETLTQLDELLAMKPNAQDIGNFRPMVATLAKFPDQFTSAQKPSTLKLHNEGGDLGIPVSINGHSATYTFDTGANLSLLSESEAKRLGLTVDDVSTKMEVMTGAQVPIRIAEADELRAGDFRLRHVAFMVFPDSQPPFDGMPVGERGIIGISVLLAFQVFNWGSDGTFQIGLPAPDPKAHHTDLLFDQQIPVLQLVFEDKNLLFSLDTGAEDTGLYATFADAFPQIIATLGKKESHKITGVGGSADIDVVTLLEADFQIGGFPIVLRPATVFLKQTTSGSRYFHGNLGMDLLKQSERTTIDFKAMTLTLQ